MAILRVAQMGHPVLRMVADPLPVDLIGNRAIQRFFDDLVATMVEYDGAGLAAPQVHESIRVAVLTLDDERGPEFFVNPVVTPLTTDKMRYYEGCLSVEGMRAAVERPSKIRVEALDRHGEPMEYELSGFPAIVVQHELDHLDGVLFVDRCDTRTLAFLREFRRFGPLDEEDWEELDEGADGDDDVDGDDDGDDIDDVEGDDMTEETP